MTGDRTLEIARRLDSLVTELSSFSGFDLTDDEATDLINEACAELNSRGEWFRAVIEVDTTVSGTGTYDFPTSTDRLLRLYVDDVPWSRLDLDTIKLADIGQASIAYATNAGVFAPTEDDASQEQVRLYPTPTTTGLSITAQVVVDPPTLDSDADTTVFPSPRFDRALVDYVAAVAYAGLEDNSEESQIRMAKFEEKAVELRRLRIGRVGRGPRRIPVVGVNC